MTNKIVLTLLLNITVFQLAAQIYNLPLSNQSTFDKITYIKVFDLPANRYGLIFYYPSVRYKDTVTNIISREFFKQCKDDIAVYKFKHNPKVYDNYNLKIIQNNPLHSANHRVLIDSIAVEITANSYFRRWSIWRMHYSKHFDKVEKLYTGYFKISRLLISSADNNYYRFENIKVELIKEGQIPYVTTQLDLAEFNKLIFPKLQFEISELDKAQLKLNKGANQVKADVIPGRKNSYYFYTFLDL